MELHSIAHCTWFLGLSVTLVRIIHAVPKLELHSFYTVQYIWLM